MSNTNENDELLNSSNESNNSNDSNLGTESGNNDSNNDSENNNEEEDVTGPGNDGKGGMTAENSGGTPHKGNRPKPDVGIGAYGLR